MALCIEPIGKATKLRSSCHEGLIAKEFHGNILTGELAGKQVPHYKEYIKKLIFCIFRLIRG
ncbi:hypothetical protein HMPREF0645_1930 [Hallella bergensis DSM 17361]|uniref:Uncharacterized protein n=1 Tax=Hallella bergensis DSM 17361 TaxID=585502 RepID=D1PY95_9BACT|nr:hypothetical protein HMPREF0645_1930 [Hallella bergensis DSM 17361]